MVAEQRYLYRGQATDRFVVAASTATQEQKNSANFICDGTADDVEIQAAIAALPSTGGTVVLTAGTFTLAARLTLTSNYINLRGAGMRQTTLTLADSANTNVILIAAASGTLTGISIESLTVDGNGANQTDGATVEARSGIYYFGQFGGACTDLLLRDLYVTNCRGMGMSLDGDSGVLLTRARLDRVYAINNGGAGYGFACDGIHVAYASDIKFTGVHSEGNTDTGIALDFSTGALYVDCMCKGNTSNQFAVARGSKYVSMVACTADGNGTGSYGIRTGQFGDAASGTTQDLQLYGCRIIKNTTGLQIDNHVILQAQVYCPTSGGDGNTTGLAVTSSSILLFGSGNVGITAASGGTNTVASGQTSVTFNHNLNTALTGISFTVKHVTITLTNNPTNNVRHWVSAVSSTQITVSTSADPGAGGLTFAWQARLDV